MSKQQIIEHLEKIAPSEKLSDIGTPEGWLRMWFNLTDEKRNILTEELKRLSEKNETSGEGATE